MNYCELIRKIAADPLKLMSAHLGRLMTVRDELELQEHVESCTNCQEVIDGINEKYPAPNEFYKGELN
jgi:hypothetical protein